MTALHSRSLVSAPASSLTVGQLLGIVIGGFGLLSLVIISWFTCIRWKDRRLRRRLEWCESLPGFNVRHKSRTGLHHSPILLKRNTTRYVQAGWRTLSSAEQLHGTAHATTSRLVAAPRVSGPVQAVWFPSVPQEKVQQRVPPSRRLEAPVLSAIIESPISQSKSPQSDSEGKGNWHIDTPSRSHWGRRNSFRPRQRSTSLESSPADSPSFDASPCHVLNPATSFSARSAHQSRPGGRCHSVPSILADISQNAVSGRNGRPVSASVHVRSFSMGSEMTRAGPTGPLPPVPVAAHVRDDTFQPRHSEDSATSMESTESLILNTTLSPTSKAARDFSERHPELCLGAQIRENDPNLKGALIAGPRPVRSRITLGSQLQSSHGSFLQGSTTDCMFDENLDSSQKQAAQNEETAIAENHSVAVIGPRGQLQASQNSPPKSVGIIHAHALCTPRKASFQVRNVSAAGSPPERRPGSAIRSRGVQNMPTDTITLPRDASQTPVFSVKSNLSNPFPWDSPVQTKRLILKNSPKRKTHMRQNCVRISLNSTVGGPPSNINSSTTMGGIKEERTGGAKSEPNERDNRQAGRATVARSLPVAACPSSISPDMARKTNSLTASLIPQSWTLPLATIDQHKETIGSRSKSRTTGPFDSEALKGQSPGSSACSIPDFPLPGTSCSDKLFHFASSNESLQPTSRTPSPTAAGSSRTIPGLTLVNALPRPEPEFRFPTVHVDDKLFREAPTFTSPITHSIYATTKRASPLRMSPALRTSLCFQPKSTATTKVSEESLAPTPTRITPLSSTVNPLNTKPDFLPPSHVAIPMQSHNQRTGSPPDLVKSIKTLRRMDSDVFESVEDCDERRQYLRVGREPSPEIRPSNIFAAHAQRMKHSEESTDNENTASDGFERTSSSHTPFPQIQKISPKPKKKVAWGGVDFRERSLSETPKSLYDAEGFLAV